MQNRSIQLTSRLLRAGFSLASVGLLSLARAQTPPEDVLGFKPGADFHLANYEQAMTYLDRLDAESDRMVMMDMGETTEGRRMRYAVISSAENLARLERHKEIARLLSLAQVDAAAAERLAEEGRAVVWIDGGLHATEVAPAQVNIQLAYDLVTGDDRRARQIRENVIALIVFANPDGQTMVSDWYMGNVGTEFETSAMPELYHRYAGHDNNRDSMLANLKETANMNRATSHEWLPVILYNQHQSAPFPSRIFLPPEAESTNPNSHPLVIRWKNLIGTAMGKALDEAGQPGAISRINYDSWWPGYVTQIVESHNIPAILTETALYRYATPHFYTLGDFPAAHQDLVMGAFYPSPWRGGWWRLGDAVAYNVTACLAVLETAAKYRHEFLFNKWRMATDVKEQFAKEPPYGWIFTADQRDASTATYLLDRMMLLGAEVYRANAAFTHAGLLFPAGSHVVPTSQPFGLFVKNMFEIQNFPDLRDHPHLWQGLVGTVNMQDAAPLRPYDGVGWTLQIQMGVEALEMARPLDDSVALSRVESVAISPGAVIGSGRQFVFPHTDNNSLSAARAILAAGGSVSWSLEPMTIDGATHPPGTFVVAAGSIDRRELERIVASRGITLRGGRVDAPTAPLSNPRLAIYKSWVANMDAGWLRWVCERYGFAYHLLTDAEVRAGGLRDRFDVILLSDQGAGSIVNGHRKGTIPPDYVGGITRAGVENLKAFVRGGGVLVCNKGSAELAIDAFELPVRNALRGSGRGEFNIPGSIVKMNYDVAHPIAFGMTERGVAYFDGGARGYDIGPFEEEEGESSEASTEQTSGARGARGARGGQRGSGRGGRGGQAATSSARAESGPTPNVVARFPEESLLVSGWETGADQLEGKAAVLEAKVGDGRVVIFGFNAVNRAQAFSTFKLLLNALYYR